MKTKISKSGTSYGVFTLVKRERNYKGIPQSQLVGSVDIKGSRYIISVNNEIQNGQYKGQTTEFLYAKIIPLNQVKRTL
jgi:hypothetical protein